MRGGCEAGSPVPRAVALRPSAVTMAPVAVTDGTRLDARALRRDFPIFEEEIHGKPLAFLDSAASSQKPRQMLEAMTAFYETSYANVHRGVYELAERATAALEHARERVRAFLNAPAAREVVFVRNATEAINLVAYAWGLSNLGPGDLVVVTELEHHSNFVPWQFIAGKTGATLALISLDEHGELDLSGLDAIPREGNVKVVATNLVSNSLGTINPVERLVRWAHGEGAIFVCDAAQAAPHMRLDVQALGADFVAVSGHKMCGPSGVGVLWGRAEILGAMDPFLTGGHMINSVRIDKTTWGELPHKFEAGTAPMAEAVGLGAAIDYLEAAGLEAIEAHEHELAAYALGRLAEVPGITLYGPPAERRSGIVSFNLEGIHPHDVAQILDMQGVAIRAGHHCCQPLMQKLGVTATNRASFYLYTIPEEVDQLVEGLHTVRKVFA
jgi:cysteine desulfurase / selenocysteine lyase